MIHSNLIYALHDGNIVYIDDVVSGKACNCVCPACFEPLIARKGQMRIHHFAHQSSTCEYGYESSLHLAAKEILSQLKTMMIPSAACFFHSLPDDTDPLTEARLIPIDHVELEKPFGSIVPDIVVYSGTQKLFVEIFVTHKVDEEKKEKIKDLGVSTIEIDLSAVEETITREALTDILQNDCPEKKWVFNAKVQKWQKKISLSADKREVIARGFALHVDYCPLHKRDFRGKAYANFVDDCIQCPYCLKNETGSILCSGASLISTPHDFKLTLEERKEKYNQSIKNDNILAHIESIINAQAPSIGNSVDLRPGIVYTNAEIQAKKQHQEKTAAELLANANFNGPDPILDEHGWRWMLCDKCGQVFRVDKMYTRGRPGMINRGICIECRRKQT